MPNETEATRFWGRLRRLLFAPGSREGAIGAHVSNLPPAPVTDKPVSVLPRELPPEYKIPFTDAEIDLMLESMWTKTGGDLKVSRLLVTIARKDTEIDRLKHENKKLRAANDRV